MLREAVRVLMAVRYTLKYVTCQWEISIGDGHRGETDDGRVEICVRDRWHGDSGDDRREGVE